MPTARDHLTAVSAGKYIYILGGRAGGASDANERHAPVADRILTPRGGTIQGFEPTDALDSFVPQPVPSVPTSSEWGLAAPTLAAITRKALVLRRRPYLSLNQPAS